MSLCEELDSEDSGASLSAAATVSAKKEKKKKKHEKNWIYLINKCFVCIAGIFCMINVHILKISEVKLTEILKRFHIKGPRNAHRLDQRPVFDKIFSVRCFTHYQNSHSLCNCVKY